MNWVHGSNPFTKLFNKLNMIQLLSMAHMDTYWGFLKWWYPSIIHSIFGFSMN